MKIADKKKFKLLTFIFTFLVFIIIFVTMILVAVVLYFMFRFRFVTKIEHSNIIIPLIFLTISSTVIGTVLAYFFSKIQVRPLKELIYGLDKLSKGEYDTRLKEPKFHQLPVELYESFNKLAEELSNTEMLRSDFINNFSHEFKTPIVSIKGFARLLKKGNLTDEERKEYLDIIISESTRLASMSTNVLNLTKIENQNILTSVSEFNLSEQIRKCILMFDKRMDLKEVSLSLDLPEVLYKGNQEQLQQVWINLIDNAVKFTEKFGVIDIKIIEEKENLLVKIKNSGSKISEEAGNRIFDKFYQGDTSHATEGTGTGLAIVKKITELHGGQVSYNSDDMFTEFIVKLPLI